MSDRAATSIRELADPYGIQTTVRTAAGHLRGRLAGVKRRLLGSPQMQVAQASSNSGAYPPVLQFGSETLAQSAKRALISYVAAPFYMNEEELKHPYHAHLWQSLEIARAFNRLGYIVDIVDWVDREFVPTREYSVFFGINDNFGRLARCLGSSTLKIFYATGPYWAVENEAHCGRAQELRRRRHVDWPLPDGHPENTWVQSADVVIAIVGSFVVPQYRRHHARVYQIDNSVIPNGSPDLDGKDFTAARRHFLWLGSCQFVRKGLDLALEAFSGLKGLDLWVCGMLHTERDFTRLYRRELFHTPNIHPIGWVGIRSPEFAALTDRCAFMPFASCAEGMCGSVLDCMGRGVIPLITPETAVEVGSGGILFQPVGVDTLRRVVTEAAAMDPERCRRMAREAYRLATTRYTLDAFRGRMESILREVLP